MKKKMGKNDNQEYMFVPIMDEYFEWVYILREKFSHKGVFPGKCVKDR